MSVLQVFLLGLFATAVLSLQDRQYCNGETTTTTYFPAPGAYKVIPTVIYVSASRRSFLLAFNPVIGEVILSVPNGDGSLDERQVTIATQFCVGGDLYSADINGDGRDDILCRKPGTFTMSVKYHTKRFSYGPEEQLDSRIVCDTTDATGNKLLLGDFDGNGADDIMCLDVATATVGATSFIYYNSVCPKRPAHSRFLHHHGHYYKSSHMHAHARKSYVEAYNKLCPIHLPALFYFPDEAPVLLSGFDATVDGIIVADSNGDGKDDLVTYKPASISYFLSSGLTTGEVFQSAISPAAVACAKLIVPADVDGDGDDDLVCVEDDATASDSFREVSFFSSGDYLAFQAPIPNGGCTESCTDSNGVKVEFSVGDFNGDGYDDVMCRWDNSGYTTGMYFSELMI